MIVEFKTEASLWEMMAELNPDGRSAKPFDMRRWDLSDDRIYRLAQAGRALELGECLPVKAILRLDVVVARRWERYPPGQYLAAIEAGLLTEQPQHRRGQQPIHPAVELRDP